jgi:predicted DNA-binding protein
MFRPVIECDTQDHRVTHMQITKRRMQVTASETSFRLLRELSALTGQAPATITRELLDEAVPALEMAVEALRDAKKRPDRVQAAMARFAMKSINDLTQAQLDLDTAMRKKPGRKPGKKSGTGAANTG